MARTLRWAVALSASVVAAAGFAGCSSKDNSNTFCPTCPTADSGGNGGDDGGGTTLFGDGGIDFGDGGSVTSGDLSITPAAQTIDVVTGTAPPTVTFVVSYKGQPVSASFTIADRGELGSVDASTGVFTPSGTLGGTVGITGDYGGATITGHVTVHLHTTANGDVNAGMDAGTSGGGYDGVGGDGTGGAVASTGTLDGTAMTDASLAWLYPYDQTVFPQGLLPPLLMWNVGTAGDYDSIKIHLTESNYEYTGYFAKPTLATNAGTPFKNYPILTGAWNALSNSNNGNEAVTVDVTLAKGTTAYKLPTRTWKIANGFLQGTVYYQAYNTQLVKNSDFTVNENGVATQVGAATLGIRPGNTGPVLIAGQNGTTAGEGCRVCHVVSSDGSTLITQGVGASYQQTASYNLETSPATQSTFGPNTGLFAWAALSPNASLLLTSNSAGGLAGNGNSLSQLYAASSVTTTAATPVTTTGWPSDLAAATPTFSPDGQHVAFNAWSGGTGVTDAGPLGDGKSLAIADFDGTSAFTNMADVYTPTAGAVVWPSFLPTNDAVVFETHLSGSYGYTWSGATGVIDWFDRKTGLTSPLTNLNGVALPDGPNGHTGVLDATYNYEPTVNPVPSGGYAWVVFTSRRIYGNVATLGAYDSDPRYNGSDSLTQPTPKKLWVAAVDLNAPGGTDPSHPAFYLPAQELLGGNSRGYWSVDPCAADGTSCSTGAQCCGGYCQQTGDGGALTCSSAKPACSQEYDKCTTTADCCAGTGTTCVNNRCAAPPLR